MTSLSYILIVFPIVLIGVYTAFYIFLSGRVKKVEKEIIDIFHKKISKIPALIEVMRPHVARSEAFDSITRSHTEVMIESQQSIYDLLGHNAKIQSDFTFLMQLSQAIPPLQKHEYFLYIRDFMIEYERSMRTLFASINRTIENWNRFIRIKNMTLIGLILPGKPLPLIEESGDIFRGGK